MSRMRKFLIALGAAAGVVSSSLADGQVDGTEGSAISLAVVGAVLVWIIPNADA